MTPEQLKASILQSAFRGKLINNVKKIDDIDRKKEIQLDEYPFDIPENWIWSTIGMNCVLYTGNSIPEATKKSKYMKVEEGYDYIGTKDVSFNHEIIYDNGVKIPFDEGFKIAKKGSILMCIEGGSAGRKIAITNKDVCFGNKLCMFNSETIDIKYLYYYLQSNDFKNLFLDNVSGIIGGISQSKLKSIIIPMPSKIEQIETVAKIEELLPLVDKYAKAYEELKMFNVKFPDEIKKSIIQYAIQGKLVEQRKEEGNAEDLYKQIQEEKQKLIEEGKIKKEKVLEEITEDEIPFDIPESWKWVRLGRCGCFERGNGIKTDEVIVEGFPCVRYGQLYTTYKTRFDNAISYISRDTFEKCHKAHKGDLLMALTGENEFDIALAVTYEGNEEIAIGGDMTKFFGHCMNPLYLTYVINSQYGIISKSKMATGNIIVHISNDKLATIPIPLPPLEEQNRIVNKIEELLAYCDKLKVRQ